MSGGGGGGGVEGRDALLHLVDCYLGFQHLDLHSEDDSGYNLLIMG